VPEQKVYVRKVVLLWQMIETIPLRQILARVKLLLKRRALPVARVFDRRQAHFTPVLNREFEQKTPFVDYSGDQSRVSVHQNTLVFRMLGKEIERVKSHIWERDDTDPNISHLWLVHLHSMNYLRGCDDSDLMFLVQDWIKENPRYESDYWHASWNSYALSIRVYVWITEFVRRPAVRDKAGQVLTRSIFQQLEFLVRNLELDLRGNHLIKNIRTLLWGSWFIEGESSKRWRQTGIKLLRRELGNQILADGMHYERTPSYHNEVLSDLIDCLLVLDDQGVRALLREKIEEMTDVASALTQPDGGPILFNDSVITSKPFSAVQRRLTDFEAKPIAFSSDFSFSEGGFSGIRRGHNFFVIKHGLMGAVQQPGHGHADIFSFEWSLEGHRFIVDKGVFEYEAGNQRDLSRATRSHNTLNIDGEDQCEMWGSFRSGRKPRVTSTVEFDGDKIVVKGSHDGYCRLAGRPVHKRQITASERCVSVDDRVIGGCGQIAEARLLLHPDCKPIKRGETILIGFDRYQVELTSNSDMKITETSWFPAFGESIKTHQITLAYGPIPGVWHFKLSRLE